MRQDEEVAAAAKETPSRASQPLIPGGELVYKSSVVAMFDKKESGKKLPIDRLLKMQVAAKRTAEREAKPASADTTPSAQPTEAAVDVEGVSTEPDDHLLRIGSDFAMAVVYSGTGKATRRVAWLGRVEKLRHKVVYRWPQELRTLMSGIRTRAESQGRLLGGCSSSWQSRRRTIAGRWCR